jgi:hypothetical protein
MLIGDLSLMAQVITLDTKVCNLVGEILGLDGDCWEEIGQCPTVRHSKPIFHLLGCLSTEQGGISLAANTGKTNVIANSLKDQTGKFFLGKGKLLSGGQSLLFFKTFFNQFKSSRLYSKVRLGKGNLNLARVTVLGDEITGVADKGDVFYLSFSSLTKLDHFPDVRKMIKDVMPSGLAGYLGFVDYLGEVLPLGISEKPL